MTTETLRPQPRAVPLACVPGAIPAEERPEHGRLLSRLFGTAARERHDVPLGYAYRFDADAYDDLARWIRNERRCCPFLAFSLELAPDDGPIWLTLAGPDGTPGFLEAELTPLPTEVR